MKKFILIIILLFSFNVYAKEYNFKDFSYKIVIDNETYVVNVKYQKTGENYELDDSSIVLTNSKGEAFKYEASEAPYRIKSIGFKYCISNPNVYACQDNLTEFTPEQINDQEYMMNYVPKFIKYNNEFTVDGTAAFLFYIGDETNISDEEREQFYDSLINFHSPNKNIKISGQTNNKHISTDDVNYDTDSPFDDIPIDDLSTDSFVKNAIILKKLIKEATDVKVCTEDDLNKIRTGRDIPFYELDSFFDNVALSSSCYNILFGEGLGDGNLYTNVIKGSNYTAKGGAPNTNAKKRSLTMGYLFYESFHQLGYTFLIGETMQKEIKPTVRCSMLGEKTTELLQSLFNILKYAGIILGTLLGVVDVFKAVVSKDADGKKQLKTLIKRIIAIIALILTPILIEIIFEMVNSIGVTDPVCGIR